MRPLDGRIAQRRAGARRLRNNPRGSCRIIAVNSPLCQFHCSRHTLAPAPICSHLQPHTLVYNVSCSRRKSRASFVAWSRNREAAPGDFFSDPFANVICDSTSDSHSNRCALFLSILNTSQTLLLVPARLHRRSRWRRGVQVEQNRVGKGKAMTRSVKETNSTQGPEDAAGSRQNAACPCAASDRSTLITPAPPRLGVIVVVSGGTSSSLISVLAAASP